MTIQNKFLNGVLLSHKVLRFYAADITINGTSLHMQPQCFIQLPATNWVTEKVHSTHFLLLTCSHRNKWIKWESLFCVSVLLKKSDSGVNRTTEYRCCLKAKDPEGHAAAKEKKRMWKTKDWQFKGSMGEEETWGSNTGSEAEKVPWKKESKKRIINQTADTIREFFGAECANSW